MRNKITNAKLLKYSLKINFFTLPKSFCDITQLPPPIQFTDLQ